MSILFDLDAVEKWANFSGDYNPIHFDSDAAAKITEEGLVVHGMLVLLAVKEKMSNLAPRAVDSGAWGRFQAVFRHPVPQSRELTIHLKVAGVKTRFTVTSGPDRPAHLQGSLSSEMPPSFVVPTSGIALNRKQVLQRWEYFLGSFPETQAPWIFLDALLFSEFIEHNTQELVQKTNGNTSASSRVAAGQHILVQTSQGVWFDHTLADSLRFTRDFDLAYSYAVTEYHHSDDRSMCKVLIEGWLDGRRALCSELGLVLYGLAPITPSTPKPRLVLA